MKNYDYLIVGSGLFGATVANILATKYNKKCLVVEKEHELGGAIRTKERDGIILHLFGAHIFHTSNKEVWNYVNSFVEFDPFINSPIANYNGELYNLPFNMNTFSKMWNINTPEEALRIINEQRKEITSEPKNLEEQAISLVGRDIYEKLIKGYTEKQWGKPCTELSPDIIKRIPVRFTFDNNYFNDTYQGIPKKGYSELIKNMLHHPNIVTMTGVDFNEHRVDLLLLPTNVKVIYTGSVDALYDYNYGKLDYRSEKFVYKKYDTKNYQGVAVMNFTSKNITSATRWIEHKHFSRDSSVKELPYTWISEEYPCSYEETNKPYYPINDDVNNSLYKKYTKLAKNHGIILGGRLGLYKYLDMDKTIEEAMRLAENQVNVK